MVEYREPPQSRSRSFFLGCRSVTFLSPYFPDVDLRQIEPERMKNNLISREPFRSLGEKLFTVVAVTRFTLRLPRINSPPDSPPTAISQHRPPFASCVHRENLFCGFPVTFRKQKRKVSTIGMYTDADKVEFSFFSNEISDSM